MRLCIQKPIDNQLSFPVRKFASKQERLLVWKAQLRKVLRKQMYLNAIVRYSDCISKEEKRHSMTFRHRARSASFFATTARMLGIISRHTFKYKWSIPVNGVLSSEIPNLNPYPLDRLFNQEQICIERMKDAEIVTDTNKLADQLKELGFLDGRIRGRFEIYYLKSV